jgi:hypothetical protein
VVNEHIPVDMPTVSEFIRVVIPGNWKNPHIG